MRVSAEACAMPIGGSMVSRRSDGDEHTGFTSKVGVILSIENGIGGSPDGVTMRGDDVKCAGGAGPTVDGPVTPGTRWWPRAAAPSI